MAYKPQENIVLAQAIADTSTTQKLALGTIVRAVDPTYGSGEFIYLIGVANTLANSWAVYSPDDWSTVLAVAGSRGQAAVSMSANIAGQYGWYQISGKAIGKALAGYLDNAAVYLTATAGSVDDAVVAGDLVKNALGASALGTPSTGLAEFEIQRPFIDGAGITSQPVQGVAAGYKLARGQAITVAASDTIVTGLTTVVAAGASMEDAPVIGCDRAQAVIGDQAGTPAAGSILLKTFKPTASGDATPVAATTFTKKVNWWAIGT